MTINTNSGAGAEYNQLYEQMDAAIAKVILGQTATSEGTPGKLGAETERAQVKEELIHADNDLIYGSFCAGPVTWLSRFNFGEDVAVPTITRDFERPEDINLRVERDVKIFQMGFKPTLDYIRQTYGEGWVDRDEPMPLPSAPAAFGQEDPVAVLVRRLRPQALAAVADWLQMIEALLSESHDLTEFRGKLAEIYPQLPSERLARVLAQALTLADLLGRSEVQDGR